MMHANIPNLPVITAGWFDLRPLRKTDEDQITDVTSDKRVAMMTPSIPHPMPPGAVAEFILYATAETRTQDIWAMDASRSGKSELMGLITLDHIDPAHSEVSFWVAPAFWNEGVAQASLRALIDANPLKNTTIFASVFQDNPASAAVVIKCGFTYLGDAEIFSVSRDASVPTWTYLRKLG